MRKLAIAVSAFATFAAAPAAAADILIDQWYEFAFGGLGSSLGDGTGAVPGTNPASIYAPDSPWTFTLVSAGTLEVVDGFIAGDQFELSDFGSVIGSTSAPVGSGTCGSDITACLADPNMSKGTFALTAGAHSITGTVIASFTSGAGFFRVSSAAPVPEPATWAMMIFGFAGIGMALRRRQSQRVRYTFA